MCLAIPGIILATAGNDPIMRSGRVDFGGVIKEVDLTFVPEADIGDYVVVHVGYALAKIDPDEALRTLALLAEASVAAETAS
jgi:hydrogenase expression/formation protein HypC